MPKSQVADVKYIRGIKEGENAKFCGRTSDQLFSFFIDGDFP